MEERRENILALIFRLVLEHDFGKDRELDFRLSYFADAYGQLTDHRHARSESET